MSRSLIQPARTLLRTALPSAPSSSIASSSTSPFSASPFASSSTAHFSTTSPNNVSKQRIAAKRKRLANIALKTQRESSDSIGVPDVVLGHIIQENTRARITTSSSATTSSSTSPSASTSTGTTPWDGCRLQRTILTPEGVWSSPPTSSPEHYLPGLTRSDQNLLFGALPESVTSILHSDLVVHSQGQGQGQSQIGKSLDSASKEIEAQEAQVETMKRILDLRNASRQGIEVVNRARIVEEFGRGQSGSSEVQGGWFVSQSFDPLKNSVNPGLISTEHINQ